MTPATLAPIVLCLFYTPIFVSALYHQQIEGAITKRGTVLSSEGSISDDCALGAIIKDFTPVNCGRVPVVTFHNNDMILGADPQYSGIKCDTLYDLNLLTAALGHICKPMNQAFEILDDHFDALHKARDNLLSHIVKKLTEDTRNLRYLSNAEHGKKESALLDVLHDSPIPKDQVLNNVVKYLKHSEKDAAALTKVLDVDVDSMIKALDREMVTIMKKKDPSGKLIQPKVEAIMKPLHGRMVLSTLWHKVIIRLQTNVT